MGLLNSILSNLGGGKSATNQIAIGGIMELLNSDKIGGLQGLISKLSGSGLGDIVESWIGTGANKAIAPNQLKSALGSDLIGQFASKLGLSQEDTIGQLTKLLPSVVDKLTPEGNVPQNLDLGNIQDILKKFM
jgi:uncharacterized protein YidB (DUF937 family)